MRWYYQHNMGYFEIILIGIGLSMDAVAVSMTNGMCLKQMHVKHAFVTALAFGLFQGIMPLIGYFAGSVFAEKVNAIDHWLALILLGFIGGKMVYEAVKSDEDHTVCKVLTFRLLLVQAIATSIDALAVGVSFAALTVNIISSVCIIAATTFILSFIAVYIGKKFGDLLKQKAEIVGGIILILIGLKIFVEHMFGI